MRQHQIDRDHLYTAFAACRKNAFLAALELTVYAEGLGDRRTGDVGIQHTAGIALARHADRHHRGEQALAYAALAGNNADDFFNRGRRIGCNLEALFAAAVRRAAIAIMRATHKKQLLTYISCIETVYPKKKLSASIAPAYLLTNAKNGKAPLFRGGTKQRCFRLITQIEKREKREMKKIG